MSGNTSQNHASCCTAAAGKSQYVDPICGMSVSETRPDLHLVRDGFDYYFCGKHCLKTFKRQKAGGTSGARLLNGKHSALAIGMLGGAALLTLFVSVIAVVASNGSAGFAVSELKRLWYWALMLAAGFGLQLGLFVHIRHILQQRLAGAKAELAASGSVSAGSMIACCSHGLVNLLPFLGISAAAAFLARYQLPFLILGVFSNLLGVTMMIGLAQKNGIEFSNPILQAIARLNMNVLRILLVITGLLAISFSFASA